MEKEMEMEMEKEKEKEEADAEGQQMIGNRRRISSFQHGGSSDSYTWAIQATRSTADGDGCAPLPRSVLTDGGRATEAPGQSPTDIPGPSTYSIQPGAK